MNSSGYPTLMRDQTPALTPLSSVRTKPIICPISHRKMRMDSQGRPKKKRELQSTCECRRQEVKAKAFPMKNMKTTDVLLAKNTATLYDMFKRI
ncbi:hypothetical protein F442_11042 [Phytophthora nicotianae P10297]|uniref:Uncharacterized protein n=1 Tax=Phytophthora nicotianae P10297 TaxID=1317064 RepID=W2Z3K4_PHYNI|nr:hypothetical protein F442_11042 [Phytophthora nicotianae P10297]